MPDWISDFAAHMKNLRSPEILSLWGAISCVGSALERKQWVYTRGSNLYPNLYITLVAPPGIGKTAVIREVRNMLRSVSGLHLSPSSMTKASLVDALHDATRHITRENEVPAVKSFNALSLVINELGVLIPMYDNEFMNALTDIYDGINYAERRRTKDLKIEIKNPNLNMLAGTTPSYLSSMMPEGAWDQGFASRMIMVYSGQVVKESLFSVIEYDQSRFDGLSERLIHIAAAYGKMIFSPAAAKAIDNWYLSGCPPEPDLPKLRHYNTRRPAHVLKLSMIACAAEEQDSLIELHHVERAIDWLLEAELYMPDIFKEMSGTTYGQLIQETWYFLFKAYTKDGKKPVVEARLVNYLQQRTAAHNVSQIIDVMERSGLVKRELAKFGNTTVNAYVPQKNEEL